MNMEVRMKTEDITQVWFRIASELQELSELLNVESTNPESWQLRQRYRRKLLALKEQAIRNSLIE